jgi:hypothetical protein
MGDTEKQARQAAIRQLTAVRAYEMWENQGRPQGRDQIHWRQAEQDVMQCLAAASGAADTTPDAPDQAARSKRVSA